MRTWWLLIELYEGPEGPEVMAPWFPAALWVVRDWSQDVEVAPSPPCLPPNPALTALFPLMQTCGQKQANASRKCSSQQEQTHTNGDSEIREDTTPPRDPVSTEKRLCTGNAETT